MPRTPVRDSAARRSRTAWLSAPRTAWPRNWRRPRRAARQHHRHRAAPQPRGSSRCSAGEECVHIQVDDLANRPVAGNIHGGDSKIHRCAATITRRPFTLPARTWRSGRDSARFVCFSRNFSVCQPPCGATIVAKNTKRSGDVNGLRWTLRCGRCCFAGTRTATQADTVAGERGRGRAGGGPRAACHQDIQIPIAPGQCRFRPGPASACYEIIRYSSSCYACNPVQHRLARRTLQLPAPFAMRSGSAADKYGVDPALVRAVIHANPPSAQGQSPKGLSA